MPINIAPGVFDILPTDPELWRNSHLWAYVESTIRQIAKDYGFQEIRTPIFERTELFARGVGETSDIVSKEMYTFLDKGNRSMSLRPEGTAPVMRAFVENNLANRSSIHKLFYIGPMFRYERTQAGRYRQHHQFGAEVIGNTSPEQDAELIDLIYNLYDRLGLKNLQVYINSIGDVPSRVAYRKALQDYLHQFFDQLSEDSKNRFETNPLRILDSKDPNDQKIAANAPSMLEFLSESSKEHFEAVKKLLDTLGIPFKVNNHLVRGLDYYNNTVFEITAGELGAQNSVGGGGRYDGLLKTIGGPDLPAIGFGTGIERILQTMIKQGVSLPERYHPILFMIPLGEQAKQECFKILHDLRKNNIAAEMDFSGRKLNKVMQHANEINAKYVVVVGENEIKTKEVELKEMSSGIKSKASLYNLTRILKLETRSQELVQAWKELAQPFETQTETDFFLNKIGNSILETKKLSDDLLNAIEKMKEMI